MKDSTFSYAVFTIAIVISAILILSACRGPETTMNFLTPDRLGYGVMDGDEYSNMVYVEWDIPRWSDERSAYEGYARERQLARQEQLEADIEALKYEKKR